VLGKTDERTRQGRSNQGVRLDQAVQDSLPKTKVDETWSAWMSTEPSQGSLRTITRVA